MLALPAIFSGCGPPKNSVTMTPLIVTVFMNSARKNSAKRMLRVLGVEAADQLLLGLDEVERRSVQLGGGGDQEDDERARMPVATRLHLARLDLVGDDPAGAQRAGDQDDRGQAEPERRLVADHLRRGPHRAEQRVLRAADQPASMMP